MYLQLPMDVQSQARDTYKLFQENPHHPSLRFKKVHNTKPIYSVRINVNYRAVGVLDGDVIIWFWIGSHAEYDKLLDHI
jgi:plasmid maintenance system killer protein